MTPALLACGRAGLLLALALFAGAGPAPSAPGPPAPAAAGMSAATGSASERMTQGKIAADLGEPDRARALFGALAADPGTPPSLACEALVRQAAETWRNSDAAQGIALFQRAHEQCSSDQEAMRLLVGAITGVEQDPQTWRGRTEDFFIAVIETPQGPEPMVAFSDEAGRDPFAATAGDMAAAGKAWAGAPVSVDVKEADLLDIFRLLHEVSGLNIVVDPSVKGRRISVSVANAPWDQLLAYILQTQGLAASSSGKVLRIATVERLAVERFMGSPADRQRQQDTLEALGQVAAAAAARRATGRGWPVVLRAREVAGLASETTVFGTAVPARDAWGHALRYWSDGTILRVASPGSDGVFEHPDLAGYVPSVASAPDDDLVWQDDAALTLLTAR